jgi:hypothetical protein
MEEKRTNSGPSRKSTSKHSIYAYVACQFHNLPEDFSACQEDLEGFGAEVIQKLTE